jgi:hypothetical protein
MHLPFLTEFGQIALEVLEIKIDYSELELFVNFFLFILDGNSKNQTINIYFLSEFECPSPLCGFNLIRFKSSRLGTRLLLQH